MKITTAVADAVSSLLNAVFYFGLLLIPPFILVITWRPG
jgi:hypothetical protein